MPLITFIRTNHEAIVKEFAAFARTLMPPDADMSETDLRDHAAEMLTAIVADMELHQTGDEQAAKSQGRGSVGSMAASAQLHADLRIRHGFTFKAVLAEFRALRATVLRLHEVSGESDPAQVRRFNEAIDEALTESMARFALQTDLFRDQFIGILSHDLRTPLGAITMGATLLAQSEDDPQRRQRVVTSVMNSARRMQRMIEDLLDLTQARLGGTIPLNRRPVDLRQLCEELVLETQSAHPEVSVRLSAEGDLRGAWDADRLGQVVSNLLGNALQHGDGMPIDVVLSGDPEAVTLGIHNGGPPIPADVLPSVFEPLARGRPDNRMHSIGLGLFIARAVVSAHGGDIQVTTSDHAGTTFKVTLPRGM